MELLEGETIDTRADRKGGRLPMPEVLWIAGETLAALEIAHKNAIIHRDLKPENIFWAIPARIKILDFGIARLRDATSADEQTRTGVVMGTPGFMAPEQALGVAEADARTDLWAVGAIMFKLLSGREVHDFTNQNPILVVATAMAKPIATIEPSVPAAVAAIIDRALKFPREERFQSAREMREKIQAMGVAAPVSSPPPGRPPSVRVAPVQPKSDHARTELVDVGPHRPTDPVKIVPAHPALTELMDIAPMSHGFTSGMSEVDTFAVGEILTHMSEVAQLRKDLGPSHPRTVVRFEEAYAETSNALSTAHIGLFWNVAPEGFVVRQILIFRADPRSPTCAKMYADGVRMLGLLPDVTREELEWIIRLVGGDIAPFTNCASFLQGRELDRVVYRLDAERPDTPESVRNSLAPPSMSEEDVPSILSALPSSDPTTRAALLGRLERRGKGHEARIGKAIAEADVELAMGLLRVLHAIGTTAARSAMATVASNPIPIVRLDALARLEDTARFRSELVGLLHASDRARRVWVLVEIAKYRIKAAGPHLSLRIKSPGFDGLDEAERAQALTTLEAVLPSRIEEIGVELLADTKDPPSEAHEVTRKLACDLLGRLGVTPDARASLEALTNGTRRGSDTVRAAAKQALTAFDARASARAAEAQGPRSRMPRSLRPT
jgi:hypothetical protein